MQLSLGGVAVVRQRDIIVGGWLHAQQWLFHVILNVRAKNLIGNMHNKIMGAFWEWHDI